MAILEADLADFVNHGRVTWRQVGYAPLSRADLLLLAAGEKRRRYEDTPDMECDCSACSPMRYREDPPDFLAMVRGDDKQLELWPRKR